MRQLGEVAAGAGLSRSGLCRGAPPAGCAVVLPSQRLETSADVYCVVIVGCLLREMLEAASLQSNFIRKGFLAVNHKYECKPANCIKACLNAVAAARILHEFLHLDACWKLILVQLCTLWVTVYPFWM